MSRDAVIAGVLLNSQSRWRAMLDFLAAIGVGLIAFFLLMFVSRPLVDAVLFEAGLNYDRRGLAGLSGAEVREAKGIDVVRVIERDGPLSILDTKKVDVWQVPDPRRATEIMAASLVTTDDGLGVWIDRSTAHALGVGIGDRVALGYEGYVPDSPCWVTVTGLLRSYQEIGKLQSSGLAIVAGKTCATEVAPVSVHGVTFSGGSETKASRLMQAVRSQPHVVATTASVTVISVGLWYLLCRRICRRMWDEAARPIRVLRGVGASRRRVMFAGYLGTQLFTLPAVIVSCIGVRLVIGWLSEFYVQPLNVAVTMALGGGISILAGTSVARGRGHHELL